MQTHIEAFNMKRREFITGAASAAVGMAGVWMARRVYGAEHCRPTGELQAADISVDGCADVRVSQDVVTVTSTGAVSFVRLKMGESLAPEAKE